MQVRSVTHGQFLHEVIVCFSPLSPKEQAPPSPPLGPSISVHPGSCAPLTGELWHRLWGEHFAQLLANVDRHSHRIDIQRASTEKPGLVQAAQAGVMELTASFRCSDFISDIRHTFFFFHLQVLNYFFFCLFQNKLFFRYDDNYIKCLLLCVFWHKINVKQIFQTMRPSHKQVCYFLYSRSARFWIN